MLKKLRLVQTTENYQKNRKPESNGFPWNVLHNSIKILLNYQIVYPHFVYFDWSPKSLAGVWSWKDVNE